MLSIVFMGTPDFAKQSLEAIYNKGHNIMAVLTKEDKPQGRGMKIMQTPVKQFAMEKQIPVYQPTKIKNNEKIISVLKKINPDVICVVAYGKILPKEILEIPKLGCINVHGSLLPKYRGAAPIQWAIINGEKTTGVTTIYMDETMDTGDIILKKEIEIGDNETTGDIWEKLSKLGAELLVETLEKLENGTAKRIVQKGESSLAPMLKKEIAKIDWENKTGEQIKNLVRGLNPIMGAYTYLNNKKIKFWKVETLNIDKMEEEIGKKDIFKESVEYLKPGVIIYSDSKKGLYIKANKGIIKVLEIQAENSKKMDILEYLKGNKLSEDTRFE